MTLAEKATRYLICIFGLFLSAVGIMLITKSGLGTSQISSLPYVSSFIFPISLGTATFIMNAAFVLVQYILMGKDFGKNELMQIPMTFLFSLFIDVAMFVAHNFVMEHYAVKIGLCLAGSAVLAFGISLQITASVAILPGEGIVRAVSKKTGKHFGTIKTIFDLSLVLSATIVSFCVLGRLVGIREGTLIAALIVGSITRFFLGYLEPLKMRLSKKNQIVPESNS